MIPLLHRDTPFPPVEQALTYPNGLLAAGADLSPQRLLNAYQRGIFPWFSEGEPILWWTPDPRMVLVPAELKLTKSLRKTLRNGHHEVRFDTAFEQVMRACAEPREGQNGTWISEAMIAAYGELHRLGYAHSVETWLDGELVGGLYGMAIGRMFYGESMFSRLPDASKIALARLCAHLQTQGCELIDCQMNTPHLASLGGKEVPRSEFLAQITRLIQAPAMSFAVMA
ncbi:Leucyl/phenylalanyl-tRNA--protein transferase [Ferriphaselus amnicola]|uniref:Leucyl/phenylalanyl-tRNA--protein transferase n=1 Tax=Ferriphaselus amnicola TaxID=1188319 RepID=A0A2Z6GA28_9PROT|nr:leucyl/phenylalanyl-tRNA--protein transferase [Ferriphaselus amnicola]BBE50391.1 Leucyl/phenylalanyl-tRNA--protein transferase [Ferriphaselus amnicola]